jgi:hypothetical protein
MLCFRRSRQCIEVYFTFFQVLTPHRLIYSMYTTTSKYWLLEYVRAADATRNSTNQHKEIGADFNASLQKPKSFQDFPSHRILRHMHGVLNIDENKN